MTRALNKPLLSACLVICVLSWGGTALAAPRIQVMALFPGKAMLAIDGKNRLLRAGQQSPEGVRLISANANEAVVEIEGRQLKLQPGGGAVRSTFAAPEQREVRIARDRTGSYRVAGGINGRAVTFLVDTGATSIAISEVEGRRLGIPFELDGVKIRVGTASGSALGWRVQLNEVRVGEIVQREVEAVVIQGTSPTQALLGMSFINHLEFENQGNLMVLRQKF